jgi:hypothetical protein
MKILVATRNQDKFDIVCRMVSEVIPDAHLVSLQDGKVTGDVVEVGSIAERAVQKARYFLERLGWLNRVDDFDAVMAMDDGLSINSGDPTPNSKELTDRILLSEWPIGTAVTVVRAFALIKRSERERIEITTVPFEFLGNPNGVSRETGKYPLSKVLAPVGTKIAVSEWSMEDENAFNLSHSSEALQRLFS